MTPKRQKLSWCRGGFSSVAALNVSMDSHILFELDSDTTDEVRHILLWFEQVTAERKDFFLISSVSPVTARQKVGYFCVVLLSHYFYRNFKWRGEVFVFSSILLYRLNICRPIGGHFV